MNAVMVVQSTPRVTPTDYVAADRAAPRKSEYLGGEVFARGGASERHNLIVANLVAELHRQLKGRPCRVYPSDMRVRILQTGLYAYPDVTVVCGRAD
jgi:Uma2 family endonuclease